MNRPIDKHAKDRARAMIERFDNHVAEATSDRDRKVAKDARWYGLFAVMENPELWDVIDSDMVTARVADLLAEMKATVPQMAANP